MNLHLLKKIAKSMQDMSNKQRLKTVTRQLNLLDGLILDQCLTTKDFK
jgi:hypothetical protein